MEKDKTIKTIKSLLNNILSEHSWDYDDDYNRSNVKEAFDKIGQSFVDGGLIHSFMNVFDMTNNLEDDNKSGKHTIDIYLKFEKNEPYVVLSSNVEIIKNIDISINNSHDLSYDTYTFRKEILGYLKMEDITEMNKFLTTKAEMAKKYKIICINEQKFEPAAEWRDVEKFVLELISKMGKIGIGENNKDE